MALIYPILRPLKIDLKQKLILFGLFSLGLLSIMCNVGKAVVFLEQPFVHGYIWASTEITVAIICASIPMLRPLFYKSAWMKATDSAKLNSNPRRDSRPWTPNGIDVAPVKPTAKLGVKIEYETYQYRHSSL